MRFNLKASFLAAIAIISGVIVLLGYFIEPLADLRTILLNWAVILIAVLLLIGVVNLARTHWNKVKTNQTGGVYSVLLLFSLFATIAILVADRMGLLGTSGWSVWLLKYITIPVESSLVAILAIILIYSIARLFVRRLTLFSMIFIVTALFIMVGTASLPVFELPILREARDWVMQVPASAGARGILLGVALGTIATGLRILTGSDRPYGG